ncbi:hypothetical protein HUT18_18325 [Streptomyces sp. NA04227]|uniref:hypothetical protein n=1 Tax=Streptomyces sp. NA04227 TaxID=2742136 RepID=UPI0015924F26|nr:hypothetical protein [Streptomyces sp. NA04227]QKW08044.1 hypothetical protein HUT18_18325 [Streptomyces sp. NA04227]
MSRVYATRDQFAAFIATNVPNNAEDLLVRASEIIDTAVMTAVYDVDEMGYPAEARIRAALAGAVCAQVEYMLATGEDGTVTGEVWDSVSIGPVSLSGRQPTNEPQAINGVEVAPRAVRLLRLAALLPGTVTSC